MSTGHVKNVVQQTSAILGVVNNRVRTCIFIWQTTLRLSKNKKKNHACTTKRNYLSDKNHHYGGFKELFELQKSSKMNTNYWLFYIQWTSYSAGLPARDQRGPLCYDCTEQQAADDCNRVTMCGLDYVSLRPLVTSPY